MNPLETGLRNASDLAAAHRYSLTTKFAGQPKNTAQSYAGKQQGWEVASLMLLRPMSADPGG
jgi:hypothetical protein